MEASDDAILDPRRPLIGGASAGAALSSACRCSPSLGIGVVTRGCGERRPGARPRGGVVAAGTAPEEPAEPLHPAGAALGRQAEAARVRDPAWGACAPGRRSVARTSRRRGPEAEGVLDDLRRLAEQVDRDAAGGGQLDCPKLSTDLVAAHVDDGARRRPRRGAGPASIASRPCASSSGSGGGWTSARVALQTRIEAGTLGLQQLAAQVGEMAALGPERRRWRDGGRIEELTTQLDALRAGLGDAGG